LWYSFYMTYVRIRNNFVFLLGVIVVFSVIFTTINVYAGKLYIKPELERKRAARLLNEADLEFRNGKIHITLSPEIAYREFELSKKKYKQAIELIETYGAGYYTPGDVEDFNTRIEECELWMEKCRDRVNNR